MCASPGPNLGQLREAGFCSFLRGSKEGSVGSLHDVGITLQGSAEGDQGAGRPPCCGHKGGGDIGSTTDSVGY